jgi:hypothetical protein
MARSRKSSPKYGGIRAAVATKSGGIGLDDLIAGHLSISGAGEVNPTTVHSSSFWWPSSLLMGLYRASIDVGRPGINPDIKDFCEQVGELTIDRPAQFFEELNTLAKVMLGFGFRSEQITEFVGNAIYDHMSQVQKEDLHKCQSLAKVFRLWHKTAVYKQLKAASGMSDRGLLLLSRAVDPTDRQANSYYESADSLNDGGKGGVHGSWIRTAARAAGEAVRDFGGVRIVGPGGMGVELGTSSRSEPPPAPAQQSLPGVSDASQPRRPSPFGDDSGTA